MTPPKALSLKDTIGFLISLLTQWARIGEFGTVEIVVQDGQIVGVNKHQTYRGSLPIA